MRKTYSMLFFAGMFNAVCSYVVPINLGLWSANSMVTRPGEPNIPSNPVVLLAIWVLAGIVFLSLNIFVQIKARGTPFLKMFMGLMTGMGWGYFITLNVVMRLELMERAPFYVYLISWESLVFEVLSLFVPIVIWLIVKAADRLSGKKLNENTGE